MQTLVNRKKLKHAAVVLLFVLPAFIPLFIFWLYPIGRSIWLSFTDWDFMTPEYHFCLLYTSGVTWEDITRELANRE